MYPIVGIAFKALETLACVVPKVVDAKSVRTASSRLQAIVDICKKRGYFRI